MWVLLALLSAFFAGLTSVLAKIGISNTDSAVVTAIRTIFALIFSWLMVFIVGSQNTILNIETKTLVFLIFSGISTGAAWLCYFKALKLGDISKITPIDKFSTVLTMLLAVTILDEKLTIGKYMGIIMISLGTYMMIAKNDSAENTEKSNIIWLIYAALSAIFTSLTSILGKIGIVGIESNLGTAIRTIIVLFMAWGIVFFRKKQSEIKKLIKKVGFL